MTKIQYPDISVMYLLKISLLVISFVCFLSNSIFASFQSTDANDLEEIIELNAEINLDKTDIEKLDKLAKQCKEKGVDFYLSQRYDSAITYFYKSLEYFGNINDSLNYAKILNNISITEISRGKHHKALKLQLRALEIKSDLGDDESIANSMLNIGNIYFGIGDNENAKIYFLKCYEYYEKFPNKLVNISILNNLGLTEISKNNYSKAINYFQQCEAMANKLKDTKGKFDVLNNLGWYSYLAGNQEYGYRKSIEAIEFAKDQGFNYSQTLCNIGQMHFEAQEYKKALDYFNEAQFFYEENTCFCNYQLEMGFHNTYKKLGDTAKALIHLEKSIVLEDSLDSESHKIQLDELVFKYHTELDKHKIEILKKEKEKQNELYEKLKQKNKVQLKFITIISFLVAVLIVMLVFSLRNIRTRKNTNINLRNSISDLEETKHELESQSRKFEKIVDKMPVMINAFDQNRQFVLWNKECEEVTGYSSEEMKDNCEGMKLLYPNSDYLTNLENQAKTYYKNVETEIVCKNGSKKTISWSNVSEDAPIEGWDEWAIGIDVTELKEWKKSLELSKNKIHTILSLLPDLVLILDINLNIKDLYPPKSNLPRELLQLNKNHSLVGQINDEEILEKISNAVNVVLSSNDSYAEELNMTCTNQSFILNARFRAMHDNEVLVIIQDISKIKQNEIDLIKQTDTLKNIFESSPNAIVTIDLQGKILTANKSTLKLFAYPKENYEGNLNFADFICPESRNTVIKNFHTLNKINTINNQYKFQKWNGDLFIGEINSAIIRDKDGNGIEVVSIIQDISEKEKNLQELKAAMLNAEKSDKLKSAFLANMSHEIRTPMNSIIGFAELLRYEHITKDERETYLKIIEASSNSLLDLIDDIIDISKIEVGEFNISMSEFRVDNLLKDIYSSFQNYRVQKKKTDIELIINEPKEIEYKIIKSDYNRLRQILVNLLTNAFKFTEKGTIEISSKIITNHWCEFSVRDTGIGISEKNQKLIFESFRQADDSISKKFGGTGLGLAISKSIVEILNGSIWVNSKEGEGSTFSFRIPCNKVNIKKLSDNTNPNIISDFNWSDKHILIADDLEPNFQFLSAALKKTNAKISWAKNGKEVLQFFENGNNTDLILMDIKMPELNGYDTLKELIKQKIHIPVIAQTAFAMANESQNILDNNFTDYIAKPIKRDKLLKIISKHI